jgi:hypothetical protein
MPAEGQWFTVTKTRALTGGDPKIYKEKVCGVEVGEWIRTMA